jgi:phosphoglycolate phosphatase-like HAD superfamily hydrolase
MQATFVEQYLLRLNEQLAMTPAAPCPGVPELLARIAEVTALRPGLATGNFEAGAMLKLTSATIDIDQFAYGAFGDDHHERADVVGLALERARVHAGSRVTGVVVGDTPRDLQAARDNSLACVLVATGPYGRDELEALGPDLLLEDLSDVDGFLGWLSGLGA